MVYNGEIIDLEAMLADETEQEAPAAPVVRRRGRPPAVDDEGNPKKLFSIEALEAALEAAGVKVGYDAVGKQMIVEGVKGEDRESLCENLPVLVYNSMQAHYSRCSIQATSAFLSVIASRNKRNPPLELLSLYTYDGKDYLSELFQILNLPENDGLSKTLIRKWAMQSYALLKNDIAEPFGADGVLVLVGVQGLGKTSVLRKLAMKPQFFKEGVSLDFRNKDSLILALSGWISELGEVESTLKGDIQKLKAFLTSSTDEIRKPYGRSAVKSARRTSFCGSCNSSDFLVDTSGNRRFWTVEVQRIDLERLKHFDALQFWKQIQQIVEREGLQAFRLTQAEQAALADRNRGHEKPLTAQDELMDILQDCGGADYRVETVPMTVSTFKIMNSDTLRNYSARALGQALDRLGYEQKIVKIDGKTQRVRMLPRRVYD